LLVLELLQKWHGQNRESSDLVDTLYGERSVKRAAFRDQVFGESLLVKRQSLLGEVDSLILAPAPEEIQVGG
jgi:hypothetical protein